LQYRVSCIISYVNKSVLVIFIKSICLGFNFLNFFVKTLRDHDNDHYEEVECDCVSCNISRAEIRSDTPNISQAENVERNNSSNILQTANDEKINTQCILEGANEETNSKDEDDDDDDDSNYNYTIDE
jgi:hypothetical protein